MTCPYHVFLLWKKRRDIFSLEKHSASKGAQRAVSRYLQNLRDYFTSSWMPQIKSVPIFPALGASINRQNGPAGCLGVHSTIAMQVATARAFECRAQRLQAELDRTSFAVQMSGYEIGVTVAM
eukprot:IDg8084t1